MRIRLRHGDNISLNYTRSHLHWDSTDFLINDLLWVLEYTDYDMCRAMAEVQKFKHRGVDVLSHKRTQLALDETILDSLKMALVLEVQEIEIIVALLGEMNNIPVTAEWLNDWIVYLKEKFGELCVSDILRIPSFLCILE